MMRENDYLLAIDIGTTKVSAVAARRNERQVIEILGHGIHPCSGLSADGIVDLEEIVASISNACRKALNHTPGLDIRRSVVGLSGTYIQSQNTVGSVVLSKHGRTVTQEDIGQCIEAAISKSVPKDFDVIHPIPRWFRLDEASSIRDPLGMEGSMLEVDVHLIIGRQSILKNLKRCVVNAGYIVEEIASPPITSSLSVLNDEEKNIGTALVELGGETTSLLVYYEGSIYHSETIGIGGEDITRDINHYFQTPLENAEKLKKYSGSAWAENVNSEDMLEIVRFKNRRTIKVPKKRLCEIIEARVEQIGDELIRSMKSRDLLGILYGGLVLTGGTAMLDGIREKIQTQSQRDTHIGYPNGVVGYEDIVSSPGFATVIGLLHYGFERRDAQMAVFGTGLTSVFRRMLRWMQETF